MPTLTLSSFTAVAPLEVPSWTNGMPLHQSSSVTFCYSSPAGFSTSPHPCVCALKKRNNSLTIFFFCVFILAWVPSGCQHRISAAVLIFWYNFYNFNANYIHVLSMCLWSQKSYISIPLYFIGGIGHTSVWLTVKRTNQPATAYQLTAWWVIGTS